jgi:hypothetical protein
LPATPLTRRDLSKKTLSLFTTEKKQATMMHETEKPTEEGKIYDELPEVEGRKGLPLVVLGLGFAILASVVIVGVTVATVPNKKPVSNNVFITADPTAAPVKTQSPTAPEKEASGAEDCAADTQLVEFFIQLDQDSNQETGWTLQCDHEEIWNVPIGYLEETKNFRENNQMLVSTCVDATKTCDFTIQDSYGDGLVEGDGYFYLRYGATTVASYDMSQGMFAELSYCFGPDCNQAPLEDSDECAKIYLSIGLDANPDDISYQVECNDEVVLQGPWGEPKGSFDMIEEETCMPLSSCCKFTVTDSRGDGLTAVSGGDYGWIYLEYGLDQVFGYSGDDDGAFTAETVDFGYGC